MTVYFQRDIESDISLLRHDPRTLLKMSDGPPEQHEIIFPAGSLQDRGFICWTEPGEPGAIGKDDTNPPIEIKLHIIEGDDEIRVSPISFHWSNLEGTAHAGGVGIDPGINAVEGVHQVSLGSINFPGEGQRFAVRFTFTPHSIFPIPERKLVFGMNTPDSIIIAPWPFDVPPLRIGQRDDGLESQPRIGQAKGFARSDQRSQRIKLHNTYV
jgi:hypothetical protein